MYIDYNTSPVKISTRCRIRIITSAPTSSAVDKILSFFFAYFSTFLPSVSLSYNTIIQLSAIIIISHSLSLPHHNMLTSMRYNWPSSLKLIKVLSAPQKRFSSFKGNWINCHKNSVLKPTITIIHPLYFFKHANRRCLSVR